MFAVPVYFSMFLDFFLEFFFFEGGGYSSGGGIFFRAEELRY